VEAERSAAHTSGGQHEPPVLFYDFNMPPRYGNGLFSVMPAEDCIHYTGQRVVFGCQSDEVMALGVVEEIGKDLLGVRWLGELPVYRSPL